MSYPEAIEVGGIEYDINSDYSYALACFRCINDPEISDLERSMGVIGILYKDCPEDEAEALRLAIKFLQRGKDAKDRPDKTPDMDFEQDDNYIRSSFMSDYKIDLDEAQMHWWKFYDLVQGLTDNCILNRVRDLRNYDLSTVSDPKTKAKIIQAQREVALEEQLAPEEQQQIDDFYAQLK